MVKLHLLGSDDHDDHDDHNRNWCDVHHLQPGYTSENPDSVLVFLVSISGRVAARYPQYQSPKPKPLPQWRDVLADHANSIGPVGHRVVVPGSPFEKEVPDHQGVFTCQVTMHLWKVEDSH